MAKGARKQGGSKPNKGSVGNNNSSQNIQTNNNKDDLKQSRSSENKNKFKKNREEAPVEVAEAPAQNVVSDTKKETKILATTEQLRIAKLVDSTSDDPNQRKKIQTVLEITGRPEDEVATALFDAGWDQNRAIEMLIEGNFDDMGAWEETGKKKKKKPVEDKQNGEEKDTTNTRDRSIKKGPQKTNKRTQGHQKSFKEKISSEKSSEEKSENPRGGQKRDPHSKRSNNRSNRGNRSNEASSIARKSSLTQPHEETGFSGSIDTWTPPGENKSANTNQGNPNAPGNAVGGKKRFSNKDAFDNAGNWGDDFPAPEDWDNEEYTGSLAESKVFNQKSNNRGMPNKGHPMGSNNANFKPKMGGRPANTNTNNSSQNIHGNNYSSIDLSTLLSKSTTQSTITTTDTSQITSLLQLDSTAIKGNMAPSNAADKSKKSQEIDKSKPANKPTKNWANIESGFSNIKMKGSENISKPNIQEDSAPVSYSSAAKDSRYFLGQGVPSKQNDIVGQNRSQSNGQSDLPQSQVKLPTGVEMPGDTNLRGIDVSFGTMNFESETKGLDFNNQSSESNYIKSDKSKKDYANALHNVKDGNKHMTNTLGPNKLHTEAYENTRKPMPSYAGSFKGQSNQGLDALVKPPEIGNYSNTYSGSYHGKQYSNYSNSVNQQGQNNSGSTNGNNFYNASTNSQSQSLANFAKPNSSQEKNTTISGSSSDSITTSNVSTSMSATSIGALTTNSNTLKGSNTSAGKINLPNMPPGVAGLIPPQYAMIGNPNIPTAFYSHLPQTTPMFPPYNMDDLAAIQQRNASLQHNMQSSASGYYEPHAVFSNSVPRSDSNNPATTSNSNVSTFASTSENNKMTITTTAANSYSSISNATSMTDSASSPIPSTLHQNNPVAAQQTATFNLSAFGQHGQTALPPGYTYFYGPGMAATGMPSYNATTGLYPQITPVNTAAVTATTQQFQQKNVYNSTYGSFEHQTGGNKEYSNKGAGNVNSNMGNAKGHHYWGNSTLAGNQLW